MKDKLEISLQKFLAAFEEVFDKDWAYTKEMLRITDQKGSTESQEYEDAERIYIISPNGTFLNPGVDDEIEDWGNRGALLSAYRELKKDLSA